MEDPYSTGPRLSAVTSGTTVTDRTSTPAAHPLPSGEFPVETHFDVLRRFMSVSRNGADPVEPAAVEAHGLPPHAAELNAAFLCDIGLLIEEKAGRFKPTPVAMQLINTQIADEGRARRLLRSLVEKTWFGTAARVFLRADRPESFREEDLLAALAAAIPIPVEQNRGALRVLLEYLGYTGILTRSDSTVPRMNGKPIRTEPAAVAPPSSAPVIPQTGRREHPPSGATHPPDEAADWEVIQTSEFYLKILPKSAAVKRLRKQLSLLEQKLHESAKPATDP
ncbi:MAG: hypothetical protein L3K14_04675 [Thermoplasmata archaeon]|nr:hypothetical protein [Thermoplasmata archaeon]